MQLEFALYSFIPLEDLQTRHLCRTDNPDDWADMPGMISHEQNDLFKGFLLCHHFHTVCTVD
jgi:hypothetical protein